jgi:hypothetical protein
MLWRNFPEADIRAGAQHFATLDDCNAGLSDLSLQAKRMAALGIFMNVHFKLQIEVTRIYGIQVSVVALTVTVSGSTRWLQLANESINGCRLVFCDTSENQLT